MSRSRISILFTLLMAASLLLAACGATPTPQVVEKVVTQVTEKVVVETQVVTEVKEVVVTATPEPASDANAEPAELRYTVWIGPDHPAMVAYNEMAQAYMADHPNVTSIKFDTIPFGEYTSKLTLQLAGGNPPDGGWVLESTAPQFVASGVMADLQPALVAAEGYDLADYSESALGLWQAGEGLYALPFSTSPYFILYNKDLLEAAGLEDPNALAARGEWTWETLAAAAKTIAETQDAYGLEGVDGNLYTTAWSTLTPIVRSFGGDFWDEAGNCTMNSPETVAALQFFHDMIFVDQSVVPPGEIGDFFTGRSAMTLAQISRLTKLDNAEFAWDMAPLPAGPVTQANTIGQAGLAIFANGPHRDAAIDFMAYVTNPENSQTMAAFFPSARRSVLNSEAFLTSNTRASADQMKLVVSGIENGSVLPNHQNFSQIDLAAKAITDKLWRADADVQAIADEVCAAIAPLLQQ